MNFVVATKGQKTYTVKPQMCARCPKSDAEKENCIFKNHATRNGMCTKFILVRH